MRPVSTGEIVTSPMSLTFNQRRIELKTFAGLLLSQVMGQFQKAKPSKPSTHLNLTVCCANCGAFSQISFWASETLPRGSFSIPPESPKSEEPSRRHPYLSETTDSTKKSSSHTTPLPSSDSGNFDQPSSQTASKLNVSQLSRRLDDPGGKSG